MGTSNYENSGCCCCNCDPITVGACQLGKKEYQSFGDFSAAQNADDFVILGQFGAEFPCTVVEERKEKDSISFSLRNKGSHTYPKYTGYTLKFVRMKCVGGEEGAYVMRSKTKGCSPEVNETSRSYGAPGEFRRGGGRLVLRVARVSCVVGGPKYDRAA